jgi:hypothetical protein
VPLRCFASPARVGEEILRRILVNAAGALR